MKRRAFMALLPTLATARTLLAVAGPAKARLGVCTFSCHQHWKAVADKDPGVKFTDPSGFYRYCRGLGAEGVQTALRSKDSAVAKQLRAQIEADGGYYEGELRLPKDESEVGAFETDVRLAREAGASVARSVCMGGRRYEVFKTLDDFRRFHAEALRSVSLAEPVVRKYKLKLALENHKDLTTDEQVALLRKIDSEWVGALVDTGNNVALLEEPHAVVEALAPFALSVHFKDMAVQPYADGFLLSEVPLGTGMLDLPRIVRTLLREKPGLAFNLEMGTRDPLKVPCLTDTFWATFPERKATQLEPALARVKANPPGHPPPQVSGKSVAQILAEEEINNRQCLSWMLKNLRA